MNEIYDHAVDMFIKRVLGIAVDEHSQHHREYAKKEIEEAINNPDEVKHNKKDMPQVHIHRRAAVICGVHGDGDGVYDPYDSLDDHLVIPTVYNAEAFTEDENEEDNNE